MEFERRALSLHIEKGYQQAERGELTEALLARQELKALKDIGVPASWRFQGDACSLTVVSY